MLFSQYLLDNFLLKLYLASLSELNLSHFYVAFTVFLIHFLFLLLHHFSLNFCILSCFLSHLCLESFCANWFCLSFWMSSSYSPYPLQSSVLHWFLVFLFNFLFSCLYNVINSSSPLKIFSAPCFSLHILIFPSYVSDTE